MQEARELAEEAAGGIQSPSVVPMGGLSGRQISPERIRFVKPGMEGQLPFDHRLHKDRMEKVILHFHGLLPDVIHFLAVLSQQFQIVL